MFSVTKTGTNFWPLWTAMVWPTISGMMVDRRDQVLMTLRSRESLSCSTFFIRWSSMNGPLWIERAIPTSPTSAASR